MGKEFEIASEIDSKSLQHELELCEKLGGDVEKYRHLSLNALQVEQIRLGLEHGVKVDSYVDPDMSWIDMENARITLETGIDMSKYANEGYSWLQCNEIREGIKEGIDISNYLDINFLSVQMKEIRIGLQLGIDVSVYAKLEYDWFQMKEIRLGLEKGLDVSSYAIPDYKHLTMRAIRLALLEDIDIVKYAERGYKGKELMELKRAFENDYDITPFLEKGYEAEQLEQINYANEHSLNILPFLDKTFYGAQLHQINIGLENGIDVKAYAKPVYNWFQMRELRKGIENKVDISKYSNSDFSFKQMRVLRKSLEEGVDVTEFAKVYFEPEQMSAFKDEIKEKNAKQDLKLEENIDLDLEISDESEDANEDAFLASELDDCLFFSEDNLQAILNLPTRKEPYTVNELTRILRHKEVKQGVVKGILTRIIEKEMYERDVIVAEGKKPVDGQDGKYLFYFKKEMKKTPKVNEDGSVDFKNLELFESVQKDQLLVEYVAATSGGFGYDVFGNLLPPEKGKDLPPIQGKGFRLSEDKKKYYSMMDGIVEFSVNRLEVRNIFNVSGNVDASTGNINFQGDVYITGNVEPGFSVTATGNIKVDGRCEGCKIYAQKDVLIRKGCQGQGVGVIKADGRIMGQFFESVTLEAKGDIDASYLLNSRVKSMGKLSVKGRRGVIIGGYTCAKQGVECFGLGNIAEVPTVIEVGIGKEDMDGYQGIVKKIQKIDSEIKTIEEAVSKLMEIEVKTPEQDALYNRFAKALYSQKSLKKELFVEREKVQESLTKQKVAKIVVTGKAYPGVKVFMNAEPFVIRQEYYNIVLTKRNNKLDISNR